MFLAKVITLDGCRFHVEMRFAIAYFIYAHNYTHNVHGIRMHQMSYLLNRFTIGKDLHLHRFRINNCIYYDLCSQLK